MCSCPSLMSVDRFSLSWILYFYRTIFDLIDKTLLNFKCILRVSTRLSKDVIYKHGWEFTVMRIQPCWQISDMMRGLCFLAASDEIIVVRWHHWFKLWGCCVLIGAEQRWPPGWRLCCTCGPAAWLHTASGWVKKDSLYYRYFSVRRPVLMKYSM